MKSIALVISLMIAAGCAATMGHLNTPSGKPEVTVHATLKAAQNESVHWLLANGFTVGNLDPTKEIILIAGNMPADNGNTNVWIRFNYFQPDSATTTIYATKGIWTRYRNITVPQTSQADFEELQGILNAIAGNLSGSK